MRRQDLRAFSFRGRSVSLEQHMKGIKFLPSQPALSILTTYRERPEDRPYEDDFGPDGYPRYKWRGTDPNVADNRALRAAMDLGKPLVWFYGVSASLYQPLFRVWLVDEEPESQQFVWRSTRACGPPGLRTCTSPNLISFDAGSTHSPLLEGDCTNRSSGGACSTPTAGNVPCAGSATLNCSMRRTSRKTRKEGSQS